MKTFYKKLTETGFPFAIYILLIVFIGIFFVATQGTISPSHLLNIARSSAPLGIVAMGQTIVLLTGGLDLSVGSTISMTNLVLASIMNGNNSNILPAMLISFTLSVLIGFLNGFIITRFKMQPFLVTLAMQIIVQGGYYLFTQGIARGSIADNIRYLSEGWIGIMPIAFIIWLAIWFILSWILHKSVYGRKLYLTGANMQAARLSGFHAQSIIIIAYIFCAVMAWCAGVLLSGYIGVASVDIGTDYTLNSIASSVVGGAAFTGGIGSLEGTFPGVLIITLLTSLMRLLGIPEAGKYICQGLVIAIMVAINQARNKN